MCCSGTGIDSVKATTPRIAARVPVAPALGKERWAEDIWPEVRVNGVALPMVAPLALRNEMLPAQDAAVPSDALAATFATLISAVSVAPRPTGGRLKSRVPVVVLCANAEEIAQSAANVKTRRLFDMSHLSYCVFDETRFHLLSGRLAPESCSEMSPILYILDTRALADVNFLKSFRKESKTCLILSDYCEGKRHPGIYEATIPSLLVRCMRRSGVRSGGAAAIEFHLNLSLGITADLARSASI
jgi:hypothetical protein